MQLDKPDAPIHLIFLIFVLLQQLQLFMIIDPLTD